MIDSILQYCLELKMNDQEWRNFAIARVMGREIIPIKEQIPLGGGFFQELV
jgi:hypothetical protein